MTVKPNLNRGSFSFWTFLSACLACTLLCSKSTNADIIVTYGQLEGGTAFIDLLANTPNQSVPFFAAGLSGEGGANGLEFDIQIGDGGAALGGADANPTLGAIDLVTGTIWSGHGPNQQDVVSFPLAKQSTVDTSSVVMTDGLIATVQFDTTGFGAGEIPFRITGVAPAAGPFNTTFFRGSTPLIMSTASNARLRISAIPEPTVFTACGGFFLWLLRIRRRDA